MTDATSRRRLVVPAGTERAISRVRETADRLEDRIGANSDVPDDVSEDLDELRGAIDEFDESIDELAATCRKRERRLERQIEYSNGVLDALDDVFYVLDETGKPRRWNDRLSDVTGYEDEEIESMHALEFFDEDHEASIRTAIEEAYETGDARVETYLQTADGRTLPYDFSAVVLDDPEGESVLTGIGRDVSDRTEREDELETLTDHLDSVVANVPVILYALDGDGIFTLSEGKGLEALGLGPGDVVGRSVHDVYGWHEKLVEDVERALAGERVDVVHEVDGQVFESSYQPVVDDDGSVTSVIGVSYDVTERTETERRLRERERQLSTLMNNVPGMVYRSRNEPDWPMEFVSDGCFEVTGYDPEELERGEVSWAEDVLAGEENYWDLVQEGLEAKEAFEVTYPVRTADGERRWFKEQGRGVYASDGSVEAIEGVIIDVSERIEHERELDRTRHMLAQSHRLANLGAWEISIADGAEEVWWSDETYRIHGLPVDADVDVQQGIEFFHPEDRPAIREAITGAIENGEPYDLELRLHGADGTRRWVRTIGEPVHVDGDVRYVRGSVQDITDRKERERELERFETIVQAVGDPVYTVDEDGYIQFVNDAVGRLGGYEPGDLVGEHISTVTTTSAIDGSRELIRKLVRTDELYAAFEMDFVTSDGEVVETENHMALLPSEDGSFVGTAGVVRDITERKERERELERTRDTLEQSQEIADVGGWQLDLESGLPYSGTWTDTFADILDVPADADLTFESAQKRFHPADQPRVREAVERAIETGSGYDLEARVLTDDGTERWVRSIGEVLTDGDDSVRLQGALQDITDRKEREMALKSIHETTRGLLQEQTAADVAELVAETAEEILDVTGVGLYHLDSDASRFECLACTPGFEDCGGESFVPVGAGDSVVWNAFVTEEATTFDGDESDDQAESFAANADGGLVVPIGDHGVFVVLGSPSTLHGKNRRLIETLVATAEAAFDRLESEASLRARDAELEERNRRLERQVQITEIIRSVDRSLISATTHEEIERTVCERLVENEDVSFAWIGSLDAGETAIRPHTWAGTAHGYLDAVSLEVEAETPEPSVTTALTERSTVVPDVLDGLKDEPWRKPTLASGFSSCLFVPIAFDEYSYGVLSVYADEPGVFDDLERTVFEELGENIANSITAVKTRRALHADTLLELTLRFDDAKTFLARLARRAGTAVEYEGLATRSASETRLFFSTDARECDPADVSAILDDLVSVSSHTPISESEERCLFEATVTGEPVASRLVRHGGSPRSIRATEGGLEAIVDVSPATDVREFVGMLAEAYPSVELAGRRDVQRAMHTRGELVSSLFADLTERQLEVLRTAYYAGFFEWPRETTGEEVAALLGVAQPTVNRHLRLAQRRLLAGLFENEERTVPVG